MKKSKVDLKKLGTQKYIVLIVLIALYIFFCIASKTFRKPTTLISLLDMSFYYVIMAIGVAFPIMTGGVDLSIGTGVICYALFGGTLVTLKS